RVFIDILKRIPVSAGLAGGSSDAGAVLIGLSKLFKTKLTKKELMRMGVKLGADVPFCILRGTALAEGIGEKLTPLPSLPYTHILIAKPNISVSTESIFKQLSLKNIKNHPDTSGIIEAIEEQNTKFIFDNMYNVLEEITAKKYPVIEQIKKEMIKNGASASMMSGSGSAVFGIFENKYKCVEAAINLKNELRLKEVYPTSTYMQKSKKGKNNYVRRKIHNANK
ncbi:MAG: 4-(cytidine 5'-diphospho)-2-C-methyl-D-erythritol kinase, partial [Epulopiscium sp. Nuni2H_MBin003]